MLMSTKIQGVDLEPRIENGFRIRRGGSRVERSKGSPESAFIAFIRRPETGIRQLPLACAEKEEKSGRLEYPLGNRVRISAPPGHRIWELSLYSTGLRRRFSCRS